MRAPLRTHVSLLGLCLSLFLLLSLASCHAPAVYAAGVVTDTHFGPVDTYPRGGVLGFNDEPGPESDEPWSPFVEFRYATDPGKDVDLASWGGGVQYRLVNNERFVLGPRIDLGIGVADYRPFGNTNPLLSYGVGLQADLRVTPDFSIFVLGGARGYVDLTADERCDHDHYWYRYCDRGDRIPNDKIGSAFGGELMFGFRYRF